MKINDGRGFKTDGSKWDEIDGIGAQAPVSTIVHTSTNY